jgi:tRNA(Arg) A34 adenosine deaminase TadA
VTTPVLTIANPPWVAGFVAGEGRYASDEDKMRLALGLARENVVRGTGGPFGAAVFEVGTGRLVAAGVNSVVRLRSAVLHAEIVALVTAQHERGTYTLRAAGLPAHELVVSCEPCAMCLGAILWSGVRRVVYAARGDDARRLDFDEGPVFPDTYRYLEQRGIEFVPGVLMEDGRAVLELYREHGGPIYNG